jgi:hypothetical protein
MQIRPTALTIGLIIYSFIALFYVYTEFGSDSRLLKTVKRMNLRDISSLRLLTLKSFPILRESIGLLKISFTGVLM